jgi:hypothetical protein
MTENTAQEPAASPKPLFEVVGSQVTINVPKPTGGPAIITRDSIIEQYGQNRR